MRFARSVSPVLLGAALLAGCSGDSRPSPEGAASASASASAAAAAAALEEARALVDRALSAPGYSARMVATIERDGTLVRKATGPMNVNTALYAGVTTTEDTVPGREKQIFDTYVSDTRAWFVQGDPRKQRKDWGDWVEVDRDDAVARVGVVNFSTYAEAVLEAGGAEAVKGREPTERGVDALRVGTELDVERLRTLDRRTYDELRSAGLDAVATDVWIDERNRVAQFEQSWVSDGVPVRTLVIFDLFNPVRAFMQLG